jgi:hypothetical protein
MTRQAYGVRGPGELWEVYEVATGRTVAAFPSFGSAFKRMEQLNLETKPADGD